MTIKAIVLSVCVLPEAKVCLENLVHTPAIRACGASRPRLLLETEEVLTGVGSKSAMLSLLFLTTVNTFCTVSVRSIMWTV